MSDTKCKTCRRIGQKLFLKEDRCFSPKCGLIRKPYAPGNQKKGRKGRRRSSVSEYGLQLKEKQTLKFLYGLRERQFVNIVKDAIQKGGKGIAKRILQMLEMRLDNTVYRLGFAKSRSLARQLVGHGHISVNGAKLNIPSYQVQKGDKISIRPLSASKKMFLDLDIALKKYNPPSWLKLDKNLKSAEVVNFPDTENLDMTVNVNSIIEFYSR